MSSMSRRDFLKMVGLGVGCAAVSTTTAFASEGGDAGAHASMLYDTTKCVGCNGCSNACRQWNNTTVEVSPDGLYDAPSELSADTWTLIQLYHNGDGEESFVKRQCMHCVDPACVSGCPVVALKKTPEGPVTYAPDRCIGCRYCMYACPFHIPRFEWDEKLPVVAKCNLCYDRVVAGLETACAAICPTGALVYGTRDDLIKEAESRIANNPGLYVNKIYGQYDAGGTSVLYLSHVPFEKIGFEDLGEESIPKLSEDTANLVIPTVLVGGPLVLAAIRSISKQEGWEESWPF